MSCFLTILSLALAADCPEKKEEAGPDQAPYLELAANNATILQRDPLFLMSLVHNCGDADVRLFHESPGDYAALDLRVEGQWHRIPTLAKTRPAHEEREGVKKGRLVLSHSSYAEYHAIHREGEAFLFDEPGQYELRAVARTADGELTSKAITITVEARSAKNLQRIAAASEQLQHLQFVTLRTKLPAQIKALEEVGGNIGMAIKNELHLQEITSFEKTLRGDITWGRISDVLNKHFDSLSGKMALERIASTYLYGAAPEGMAEVAQAMPHDSLWRRQLRRFIRLLRSENQSRPWVRRDFDGDSDDLADSD
jgi:hypothetical protein